MRNRVLIAVLVIAVAFFAGYRMLPASGEGLRMSPEAEGAIAEMGGGSDTLCRDYSQRLRHGSHRRGSRRQAGFNGEFQTR